MKKKSIILFVIGLFLFLLYFFGTGFIKNTSVYIEEYTLSEDGTEITVQVGVSSSMGYIRKIAAKQQGGKLYLDSYNAFGGINSNIGTKTVFTLPLDEDTTMIAIYRNTNAYEEALKKDSDGVWQRVK